MICRDLYGFCWGLLHHPKQQSCGPVMRVCRNSCIRKIIRKNHPDTRHEIPWCLEAGCRISIRTTHFLAKDFRGADFEILKTGWTKFPAFRQTKNQQDAIRRQRLGTSDILQTLQFVKGNLLIYQIWFQWVRIYLREFRNGHSEMMLDMWLEFVKWRFWKPLLSYTYII